MNCTFWKKATFNRVTVRGDTAPQDFIRMTLAATSDFSPGLPAHKFKVCESPYPWKTWLKSHVHIAQWGQNLSELHTLLKILTIFLSPSSGYTIQLINLVCMHVHNSTDQWKITNNNQFIVIYLPIYCNLFVFIMENSNL